jgi:hypothetical protein
LHHLNVVALILRAAGDRLAAGEDIPEVQSAGAGDFQVEVIDPRVGRAGAGGGVGEHKGDH